MGFNGKLRLVGRDLSQSAALMARFALHAAKFDWQPSGGIEIDVQVADALTQADALPPADLIVMNPPFLAWPMMDKERREIVSEILGSSAKHRPDLSMSFVTRALNAVNKGGVVASLVSVERFSARLGESVARRSPKPCSFSISWFFRRIWPVRTRLSPGGGDSFGVGKSRDYGGSPHIC